MDIYCLGMSVLSYATNYSTNIVNPTRNQTLNECINWCINPNPKNRPTTTELLNKLMTITKSGIYQTIYQLHNAMEDPKLDIIMSISTAIHEEPNNITLISENNCLFYLCESFKHTEDSDILLEIISLLYFIYEKSIIIIIILCDIYIDQEIFKYRINDLTSVLKLCLKKYSNDNSAMLFAAVQILQSIFCNNNNNYKDIVIKSLNGYIKYFLPTLSPSNNTDNTINNFKTNTFKDIKLIKSILIVLKHLTINEENAIDFINNGGYDIIMKYFDDDCKDEENIIMNVLEIIFNIVNTSEGLLAILVDYSRLVKKVRYYEAIQMGNKKEIASDLLEKLEKNNF